MRPTRMEVDINKFNRNIEIIQEYVGDKKIMPVIKANGYGTYINKRLDVIKQFDIVAVAIVDEAVELRKLGYKKEILILNQPYEEEWQEMIDANITIGVSAKEFLEKIIHRKENIKVHLEIETGMNRTGIKLEELESFMDKIKQTEHIKVEGIYTHLSSADYDEAYTKQQLEIFKKAVTMAKAKFNTIKYIHSSASNGLLNYEDGVSNLVRAGMLMYGYDTFENMKEKINVEPICKLKTKVTFIKEVNQGESISYARKFITKDKMKIATIPIGYADGLRRELLGKGEVVVNGKKAKIVGTICMDSCMIDVTNIHHVEVGSDVSIWDNEIMTVEEIAEKCNTINYEIMSTISARVPRIFDKE